MKRILSEEVAIEESPVGEHQSNGEVENAVQRVEGQVRTIKDSLEARYKGKLSANHPIVPWLWGYAASVITRYAIGEDGRTAFERVRGKKFKTMLAEFGESVRFMIPESEGKNKWKVRWEEGIFVGVRYSSGEYLIATEEGVRKVRGIRRLGTDEERWDKKRLETMKGTPWEPIPGREGIDFKSRISMDHEGIQERPIHGEDKDSSLRRCKIFKKDFEKYGYTTGCRGCEALISNATRAINHNEACRRKMENYLLNDEDPRLERYANRVSVRLKGTG